MSQKLTNKRQKLSIQKKEAIATPTQIPWPNLPHQLLELLARETSLMKNITSFGCVIKTWRSPSKQCNPNGKNQWSQLIEIDNHKRNTHSHIIHIPFDEKYYFYHRYYKDWKERSYIKNYYKGVHFKGHSHARVVVTCGENFSGCYLWEPVKRRTISLPNWDIKLPFKLATLSSLPSEYVFPFIPRKYTPPPECRFQCIVMVITGISHPAFAFFRRERVEKEWVFEDCDIKDPHGNNKNMEFSNAIGFRGKFYALSSQGSLVVIEDIDSNSFRIKAVGGNRAVPSRRSRQFREYLVECDGEILLVFLISRKRLDLVDDVEVFRLDLNEYLWMKVENLEGRTLFLEDECCMWVNGENVGCRSSFIYFTHHGVDDWFLYEMGTGQIFPVSGDYMRWDEPMTD